MSVAAGGGITAVYFYLYNKTAQMTGHMAPGAGYAFLLFSYLMRLTAVGLSLFLVTYFGRLDTLLTGLSFLIIYTAALLYTQGRNGLALMRGELSERKE